MKKKRVYKIKIKDVTVIEYIWIVLLGIAMVGKPDLLWKIEHFWDVKNGEPSELYIALMRVMGTFCIIGSIIFLIALFI